MQNYTLIIQKGDSAPVDTFETYGIACRQVPFRFIGDTKELPKRDWFDEHGEDTFIPDSLKFKSYELELEFAYMGQELATNPFNLSLAKTNISSFIKWLTGNDGNGNTGATLKIYSPYTSIGRQGCYLLSISDEDPYLMLKEEAGNLYNENVVTFKARFNVTDPVSEWVPDYE